jgi:hypothetical protein
MQLTNARLSAVLLPGAAGKSNSAGVGCLFLAHRGAGAYVAPLNTASSSSSAADSSSMRRISVRDESNMSNARFMESYESRHSDHSFTAAVVSANLTGQAAWLAGLACWLAAALTDAELGLWRALHDSKSSLHYGDAVAGESINRALN